MSRRSPYDFVRAPALPDTPARQPAVYSEPAVPVRRTSQPSELAKEEARAFVRLLERRFHLRDSPKYRAPSFTVSFMDNTGTSWSLPRLALLKTDSGYQPCGYYAPERSWDGKIDDDYAVRVEPRPDSEVRHFLSRNPSAVFAPNLYLGVLHPLGPEGLTAAIKVFKTW